MNSARDGMNWAPTAAKPEPVVEKGEFVFASAFFNHGHIFGQTNGLLEAGGVCKWAWDPDSGRLDDFCAKYPDARRAESFEQILANRGASGHRRRHPSGTPARTGCKTLRAGKDYYTDKSFTTRPVGRGQNRGGGNRVRKYLCDFSERLHTVRRAGTRGTVNEGYLGQVVQVLDHGPHNLAASDTRP